MIRSKSLTILLITIVVSSSGCSGSRLRNMITRSDYQSLDELEAQNRALAASATSVEDSETEEPSTEKGRLRGLLASRQRTVSEEESSAGSEKKRNPLNIAALFRRGTDSDISPDPFVAETDEADAGNVTPVSASDASATQQLVAEAAQAEDRAEELFRKANEDGTVAAFAEAVASEEPIIAPDEKPDSALERSFADFLAEQSSKKPAVPSTSQKQTAATTAIDETIEQLLAMNDQPSDHGESVTPSGFDELLGLGSDDATASDNFDEEPLFDELNELITDRTTTKQNAVDSSTAEPDATFDEIFASQSATSNAALVSEEQQNPFDTGVIEEAPATATTTSDPWAAFREKQGTEFAASVAATSEAKQNVPADTFSWADAPGPDNANPFGPVDNSTSTVSLAGTSGRETTSPFRHASSSQLVSPQETTSGNTSGQSFGSPELVIPGSSDSDPIPVTTQDESDAAFADDLFADAEEALSLPAAADVGSPAPGGSGSGISTRMWFFILGCVVVALLLFMPERQNRTNP